MAAATDLTLVKIRGKRRARPAEKWRTGKRRNQELQIRPLPQLQTEGGSSRASSSRSRKTRRGDNLDSPLEALPAEILQEIFEYAANVDLAIVSRHLALKLSKSQHLHNELTTRLLEPVLNSSPQAPPNAALAAATRLLDSRFMTFDFFKRWLKGHGSSTAPSPAASNNEHCKMLWDALEPSSALLPPKKLLAAPFTEPKVDFLTVLTQNITDINGLDAAYGELAQEGILTAVSDGNIRLMSLLLKIGAKTNTELLRVAIVDCGCNEKTVLTLLGHSSLGGGFDIDVLDPALWEWAENAQQHHDPKGDWLIALLRGEQRRRENRSDLGRSILNH